MISTTKHLAQLFCLMSVSLTANLVHATRSGPGGGNGGFTGENAKIILHLSIEDLKKKIPALSDVEFTDERKLIALEALNNVISVPTHDDPKLMFDYPRVQQPPRRIYVYRSFFVAYDQGVTSEVQALYMPAIEQRLLREASHLWGMSDPQSIDFAKRVLSVSGQRQATSSKYHDPQNAACYPERYTDGVTRQKPSCVLQKNIFQFGNEKVEIFYVCSGLSTLVFEADQETALQKFKSLKSAGGCEEQAGAEIVPTVQSVSCECKKTSNETAVLTRIVYYSDGTSRSSDIRTYGMWQTNCRGEALTAPACSK